MMDRRHKLASVAAVSAWIVLGGIVAATAHDHDDDEDRTFTFALWGDTPYSTAEVAKLPALIADINAARVAFSIFDGDIKSGSSQCTNDQFDAALQRFGTFRSPLVYVPGDNEWTDCHRINNGGFNALERLTFLRQTMFAQERSFGQRTMRLDHQGPLGGEYAENTRWTHGGVVFLSLNIPGSNNNKVGSGNTLTTDCVYPPPPAPPKTARNQADCDADNAEYQARDAANRQWLHESFELAKSRGLKGLMVVIQADMGFDFPETESFNEHLLQVAPGPYDGYDAFLSALVTETRAFDGQVVLVHGDTHFFKMDKPLVDQAHLVPNLTRLETFGSPNIHWVKVTVDPRSRSLFRFEPMIVPGN
jgi:hypothetical protein